MANHEEFFKIDGRHESTDKASRPVPGIWWIFGECLFLSHLVVEGFLSPPPSRIHRVCFHISWAAPNSLDLSELPWRCPNGGVEGAVLSWAAWPGWEGHSSWLGPPALSAGLCVCGRVSSVMASQCWWQATTVCKQWSHRWRRCARPLRWDWDGREGKFLDSWRWITSSGMCLPGCWFESQLCPWLALWLWSSNLTSLCSVFLVFNYIKQWWENDMLATSLDLFEN